MKIWLVSVLAMFVSTAVTAATKEQNSLDVSLTLGAEYNSNLTVDELDLGSELSGMVTNIDASFDWTIQPAEDQQFIFGYNIFQSLNEEYSEFDIRSHGLNLGYEWSPNDLSLGLDYAYYDTALDGEDLLTLQFITPSVSYMLSDSSLLRLAVNLMDKRFDVFTERDADTQGLNLSYYYFYNQAQSYLRWSIATQDEDAVSDELDFSAWVYSMSFSTPAEDLLDGAKFKASAQYTDRDYDNLTEAIAAIRTEQWTQVKLSLEWPLGSNIDLITAAEFNDRSSNLPSADYTENRFLIDVRFSF